jgi:hypothetical protein
LRQFGAYEGADCEVCARKIATSEVRISRSARVIGVGEVGVGEVGMEENRGVEGPHL